MEATASKNQGKFAQNIQSKNSSNEVIMEILTNKNRVQNTQNINREKPKICKILIKKNFNYFFITFIKVAYIFFHIPKIYFFKFIVIFVNKW